MGSEGLREDLVAMLCDECRASYAALQPAYRIAKCPHCGEELSVWPAAQPAAGEGLDVRSLATAIHAVMWPGQPHDFNGPDPIWGDNDCACSAAEIAREYAALRPASEDPG